MEGLCSGLGHMIEDTVESLIPMFELHGIYQFPFSLAKAGLVKLLIVESLY
uniref:Uncharacterized protein n=1 Tax=Rhizophora mucronata TaxID=61149 RepID=A0A2P2IZP8_RHIMU